VMREGLWEALARLTIEDSKAVARVDFKN
jgi:hypothetical protein